MEHMFVKEKRLIELLGFTMVGPNSDDTWHILDKKMWPVGTIKPERMFDRRYKESDGQAAKLSLTPKPAYEVNINSSVRLTYIKPLNEFRDIEKSNNDMYTFDTISKKGIHYNVEMIFGKTPFIKIKKKDDSPVLRRHDDSDRLGVEIEDIISIDFSISYTGELYLKIKRGTGKVIAEETLRIQNTNDFGLEKKYSYELHGVVNNSGTVNTIRLNAVEANDNEVELKVSNDILLKESTSGSTQVSRAPVSDVKGKRFNGTIDDVIEYDDLGKEFFNQFRKVLRDIIPFDTYDILLPLVSKNVLNRTNLRRFFELTEKEPDQRITMIRKAYRELNLSNNICQLGKVIEYYLSTDYDKLLSPQEIEKELNNYERGLPTLGNFNEYYDNIITDGYVAHGFNGWMLEHYQKNGIGAPIDDKELLISFGILESYLGEHKYCQKSQIIVPPSDQAVSNSIFQYSNRLWFGPLSQYNDPNPVLPMVGETKSNYALRIVRHKMERLILGSTEKMTLLKAAYTVINKLCTESPMIAFIPINLVMDSYSIDRIKLKECLKMYAGYKPGGRMIKRSFFNTNFGFDMGTTGVLNTVIPFDQVHILRLDDPYDVLQRALKEHGIPEGTNINIEKILGEYYHIDVDNYVKNIGTR